MWGAFKKVPRLGPFTCASGEIPTTETNSPLEQAPDLNQSAAAASWLSRAARGGVSFDF